MNDQAKKVLCFKGVSLVQAANGTKKDYLQLVDITFNKEMEGGINNYFSFAGIPLDEAQSYEIGKVYDLKYELLDSNCEEKNLYVVSNVYLDLKEKTRNFDLISQRAHKKSNFYTETSCWANSKDFPVNLGDKIRITISEHK